MSYKNRNKSDHFNCFPDKHIQDGFFGRIPIKNILGFIFSLIFQSFPYKHRHNKSRRHNHVYHHPRLPSQCNLRDGLKQQHQANIDDYKGNVLPLIFVVGKYGKANQRDVPEELVKAIGHIKQANEQQDGKGNFNQVFGRDFHFSGSLKCLVQ